MTARSTATSPSVSEPTRPQVPFVIIGDPASARVELVEYHGQLPHVARETPLQEGHRRLLRSQHVRGRLRLLRYARLREELRDPADRKSVV